MFNNSNITCSLYIVSIQNLTQHIDYGSDLDITITYSECLKVLYTKSNIDCIYNKWTELEALILTQQPNIVGITEVFPKNQETVNLSAFVLNGFQQVINPRVCEKNDRGTKLFVRNELEVLPFTRLNELASKEACWCIVNLDKTLNRTSL